jgi:hypothetical protein
MTPPDVRHVRGSELIYGSDHRLVPSDAFEVKDTIGGNYPVTPNGLSQFLDDLINSPVETNPVHLYLVPVGHKIDLPEFPPSNLHFDIDREHQVAAASLAIWDKDDEIHQWMTLGDAGRDDVLLTQDAANPDVKRFPSDSFISVLQLRLLVPQWAFSDILPPPAAQGRPASEREVGWF